MPPHAPGLILIPESEGVILAAFTVDATFTEGDTAALQVTVRARLHNPSTTRELPVRLKLTGGDSRGQPITDLRFALGTDPAQATTYTADTFERTLAPDERLWITFVYTDVLGTQPWAHFRYRVDRLGEWPTTVGSVRVTLHFPEPLDQNAMIQVAPEPSRYTGLIWDWQWEDLVPPSSIEVIFVRPEAWARVRTLRQQVASGQVAAAKELAELLTTMVTAPDAPPTLAEAFYEEALGAWTQVAAARPNDPTPWKAMATLYKSRLDANPGEDAYRTLYVAALEEAWNRGDRSDETRAALAEAVSDEIRHLRAEGRWQEALTQLDRLKSIVGVEGTADVLALREEVALAWVQDRVQADDDAGVREALRVGWGDVILGYFRPRRPALRYAGIQVLTTDTTRVITMTATLDPSVSPNPEETWQTFVRVLGTALPTANVTTGRSGNTVQVAVRMPLGDVNGLIRDQKRLVEVLPDTPEWEVFRAALTPKRLQLTREPQWWGTRITWREEVDLAPARQALDDTIVGLRASLSVPPSPDFPEALLPILQRFRERDVEAWEGLRERTDVVYLLRWEAGMAPPLLKRWQWSLGDRVVMQASRAVPDPQRLGILGAGLLVLWTLFTLAVWRWLGRS